VRGKKSCNSHCHNSIWFWRHRSFLCFKFSHPISKKSAVFFSQKSSRNCFQTILLRNIRKAVSTWIPPLASAGSERVPSDWTEWILISTVPPAIFE
jgi:hypothetical protein